MSRPQLALGVAATVGLLLAPAVAGAGNGTHPRTPVVFYDDACMTVVDKSQTSSIAIDYTIPLVDLEITPDEVSDSRTHRFFALCRQKHTQQYLPEWISDADVMAAELKMLGPTTADPENVLDTSSEWDNCYYRITPDDDRYPIECPSVQRGVDWDISGVEPGTYMIGGYTYEPQFNIWTLREGVIKVVDGAPETSAPGAAIVQVNDYIFRNDVYPIRVCIDAMDGSTLTAYWARTGPPDSGTGTGGMGPPDPQDLDFVPFLEDEPVECGNAAVYYPVPPQASGESIVFRVDVTDPMGRTYTAHSRTLTSVLPFDNCDQPGDTGSFIMQPDCDTGGDGGGDGGGKIDECDVISGSGIVDFEAECQVGDPGGGTTGTSGGSGDTTGPSDGGGTTGADGGSTSTTSGQGGGGAGGCGCAAGPTGSALALLPLLLGFGARRRAG